MHIMKRRCAGLRLVRRGASSLLLREALMSKTAIKICPKCSGIKAKHLKEVLAKDDYSCGCFGKCLKKTPELEGKAYARINGKLVACDSRKKLIKKMVAAVA